MYFLGGFLAFLFKQKFVFAQDLNLDYMSTASLYGVSVGESFMELNLWGKIMFFVFSPIFVILIVFLALVIGGVVYIKRRRKKVKKNN